MNGMDRMHRMVKKDVLNHPKNVNHTLHMVVTICTFGLWLPVWTIIALRQEGWKQSHCWEVSGKGIKGLTRINRLEISPEFKRGYGY